MALSKPKKVKRLRVASMRPSEMSSGGGGLEDRFHATIEECRVVAWAYPRKDGGEGDRFLFARVKYRPDEDDQPEDAIIREGELEKNDGLIISHYKMGAKLNHWLPSMDGEEPVDIDAEGEDAEGIYAIPTDELIEILESKGIDLDDAANYPQLNKGSNWAFWVQKIVDCGFDEDAITADITCFEGAHVRLDRVPRPAFSGQAASATGEQSKGDNKILVPTEILDAPKKSKSAAAGKSAGSKVSAKSKKVEEDEEEEDETPTPKKTAKKTVGKPNGADINGTVEAAIVAALKKAPLVEVEDADGDTVEVHQMQRTKLHQFAIKAVGSSDKKAALELMNDDDFYEGSEVLSYDADEGTVTLIEA